MSTIKTTNITHGSNTGTANLVLGSDGSVTFAAGGAIGTEKGRNLIINGAMNVAQRGTSAATTTGIFVVDRFKSAIVGADEASTTAQVALTSSDTGPWAKGFRNALQITNGNQTSGAGAGDTQQITYGVEAQDIAQSGWDYTSASSYITLAFWVKSSVAQNFYGYLRSEDGTKQLYAFETGSLSANTWTKITKTIPGAANVQFDNDNGQGFLICLYAFEGADNTDSGQGLNSWGAYSSSSRTPDNTSTWWTTNDSTFAITGVQLEVGQTATEFEHRTYGDELAKCRRYYYQAGVNDINTSTEWIKLLLTRSGGLRNANVMFRETMRAAPTVTLTGQFDDGGATIVAGGIGIERCTFNQSSSSAAGDAPSVYYWSAAAEL